MSKKEYTSVEVANEVLKKALEVYKDHIKKKESTEEKTTKTQEESVDTSKLEEFINNK